MQLQIKDSAVAPIQSSFLQSPKLHDTLVELKNKTVLEIYPEFVSNYLRARLYSPKTIDNYWWVIKSFVTCVGDIPVKDITHSVYSQWVAGMAEKGNSKITIHSNIASFRTFVDYLSLKGLTDLSKDDVKLPKKPKHRARYATADEIDKLVNSAVSIRNKTIIEVMFSTGLRNSEIRNLKIKDIHGLEVAVWGGKGDKDAVLFLSDRARKLLNIYWASRVDDLPWAFVSQITRTGEVGKIASSTLRYIFESTCKRAGLDRISPKAVRHGYGTDLMRKGVHMRKIQEAMRHAYITTTQGYVHVDEEELKREILEAVNIRVDNANAMYSKPIRPQIH